MIAGHPSAVVMSGPAVRGARASGARLGEMGRSRFVRRKWRGIRRGPDRGGIGGIGPQRRQPVVGRQDRQEALNFRFRKMSFQIHRRAGRTRVLHKAT